MGDDHNQPKLQLQFQPRYCLQLDILLDNYHHVDQRLQVLANYHQKVYYHRVGTDQREDQLIYERPDEKTWGWWIASNTSS